MTSGPRSLRCAHARAALATHLRLAAAASHGQRSRAQACERYSFSLLRSPLPFFSRAQLYGSIQSLSFNDLTGSALVEYSTTGEAVSANNALQGQAIAGQELKVAFETVGGPPQPPGRASASASAPGAPAVVGHPSNTCTPLHLCCASLAASHPALRFAMPLRRRLQSHVMSRQPPTSIHCSIHIQMGSRLPCLCWFPPCTIPTRTPFKAAVHMPHQHRSNGCRGVHAWQLLRRLSAQHARPLLHEYAQQSYLHCVVVLRRMSVPHRCSGLACLAARK